VTYADIRRIAVVPRPTGWHLFVFLLILALGTEYWDKNPLNIGSLQVPWPRFLLCVLTLPLVVHRRDWRWTRLLRLPGPLAGLIFFWAGCGLSVLGLLFAPGRADTSQFVKTFVHLSTYVIFVCALVKWMTWERFLLLVRCYYVLGVAAALLALLQFVHGTFGWFPFIAPLRFQSFEYQVGPNLTAGFRASSIFGEASWASRYYVHFIAVALAFWWHTRRRRHLAALTLFVLAFYVANSLLGYVILGSFIAAAAVTQMWRRNMFSLSPTKKAAIVAGAYLLLLFWLVGLTPPVPDLIGRSIARVNLFSQGGGAAGNRFDSVWAGLEVWKLAPTFGVGLGNIGGYIVEFYKEREYIFRSRFGSDSLYVQLLAETGLVGLMGFVWFWGHLMRFGSARSVGRATPDAKFAYVFLRFLQLDLLAQAVGMLNYADYLNPHFWTVVAIVLSCKTLIIRERATAPVAAASRAAPIGGGPVPNFAS
jgi:O-Antigen ligase